MTVQKLRSELGGHGTLEVPAEPVSCNDWEASCV